MEQPFFSILIPCLNSKQNIQQTLDSCFNQKYHDYEIILCDNCSDDNISSLLEKINNDKLKYFLGKKRVSTISVRNFLIQQASGKYIAWIEPGDKFSENYLQDAFDILKNKNFDILEYNTTWITINDEIKMSRDELVIYQDNNCLDIYFKRDDEMQDALWGKIINSYVMKKCLIDDFPTFAAEEVFYSVLLYKNAMSFMTVDSSSYYIYNTTIDHFNGLSSFNLDNVKYMCKIRNEQLNRNLKLLNTNDRKYDLDCLNKLYLFNIFNDILNLENVKEMKEAFQQFYKYFNIKLSANVFEREDNNESN